MRITKAADVLRNAGLKVVEEPGWKGRGKEFSAVKGMLCHHTGKGSVDGLRRLIREGRSDLPGPLSQFFLAEDGTWYVIADGRSNHAGAGNWQGVTAGNSQLIGVEAQNAGDGKDVWEIEQTDAYAKGCAALAQHYGFDDVMVAGHKEYALPKGRKIDPSFDMVGFREDVETLMHGGSLPTTPPRTVDPARSMLRKGDQGSSVKQLQKLLGIGVDGGFGPETDAAVRAFQRAHGLKDDGKVGPKTWEALL